MRKAGSIDTARSVAIAMVAGAIAFLSIPLDSRPTTTTRRVASREVAASGAGQVAHASADPELQSPSEEEPPRRLVQQKPASQPRGLEDLLGSHPYDYQSSIGIEWAPSVPCPTPCSGRAATCAAGHRMLQAIERRLTLLDDSDGSLGRDVLFLLGSNYHRLGDFSRAADYYETFALAAPELDGAGCTAGERALGLCPDAASALENAMAFREALGQTERAVELGETYVHHYGETRVADAARVGERTGRILESAQSYGRAASHYESLERHVSRHMHVGHRLRAQVRRGRSLWESGDRARARRAFRRALRTWRRGGAGDLAVAPDRGQGRGREFSQTLEAVAEAAFHLAELEREAFRGLTAPEYVGDSSRRDVERWVADALHPWLVGKLRSLKRAQEAYARVAGLGVTDWQIAAESRTGELYTDLMDDIRGAPAPRDLLEIDERIGAIRVADWRSSPVRRLSIPATAALERCLSTAVRTRHFGPWSTRCADELTRVAPAAHPPTVEIYRDELRVRSGQRFPAPLSGTTSRPETPSGECSDLPS